MWNNNSSRWQLDTLTSSSKSLPPNVFVLRMRTLRHTYVHFQSPMWSRHAYTWTGWGNLRTKCPGTLLCASGRTTHLSNHITIRSLLPDTLASCRVSQHLNVWYPIVQTFQNVYVCVYPSHDCLLTIWIRLQAVEAPKGRNQVHRHLFIIGEVANSVLLTARGCSTLFLHAADPGFPARGLCASGGSARGTCTYAHTGQLTNTAYSLRRSSMLMRTWKKRI